MTLVSAYRIGNRMDIGGGFEMAYQFGRWERSTDESIDFSPGLSSDPTISVTSDDFDYQSFDIGWTTQVNYRFNLRNALSVGSHIGLKPLVKNVDENIYRRFLKIGWKHRF